MKHYDSMRVAFSDFLNFFHVRTIICNPLLDQLDMCDVYQRLGLDDDDEVFQCYITDCDDFTVSRIEGLTNDVLLYYYRELDLYLLMVTHYGTSWDYVGIEVEAPVNECECRKLFELAARFQYRTER